MSAQDRFDAALEALASADEPECDIDPAADALRIKQTGDIYAWHELPEHVRDHWREQVERAAAEGER